MNSYINQIPPEIPQRRYRALTKRILRLLLTLCICMCLVPSCDYCNKTISNHDDINKDHICGFCGKTVSSHSGGGATCTDQAVCETCQNAYGEPDAANHTNLIHFPAKAATEDAEGNIEYWYCDGCGQYFSDAEATRAITAAGTVTEKLPRMPQVPRTDDGGSLLPWIALLFVSGGVCTVLTVKHRKVKSTRR